MDGILDYFSAWIDRIFSCSYHPMVYSAKIKKGLPDQGKALTHFTGADIVCSSYLFILKLYNNYTKPVNISVKFQFY